MYWRCSSVVGDVIMYWYYYDIYYVIEKINTTVLTFGVSFLS